MKKFIMSDIWVLFWYKVIKVILNIRLLFWNKILKISTNKIGVMINDKDFIQKERGGGNTS